MLKKLFFVYFSVFTCIAHDNKVKVSFDAPLSESHLENLYKIISIKKSVLKDAKENKEEYLDNALDSIIDFHVFIYNLREQIKTRKSYFKEDLEDLRYFISQIYKIAESNLAGYVHSKKEVVKILFDKALSRLSDI